MLLGMISAAECNTDEALSHHQHASDIDPEYVEPLRVRGRAVHLWDIEDFEKAVELCETALDHAEEEEEFVEALPLKAEGEALLGKESAAVSLSERPTFCSAITATMCGRAVLALIWVILTMPRVISSVRSKSSRQILTAVTGLACVRASAAIEKETIGYYQKCAPQIWKLPTPPWGISHEEFSKLTAKRWTSCRNRSAKLIANVPVIASDYPSAEQVADGTDPRILGLFSGVPYGDKPTVGGVPHLDTILLFSEIRASGPVPRRAGARDRDHAGSRSGSLLRSVRRAF